MVWTGLELAEQQQDQQHHQNQSAKPHSGMAHAIAIAAETAAKAAEQEDDQDDDEDQAERHGNSLWTRLADARGRRSPSAAKHIARSGSMGEPRAVIPGRANGSA